MERLFTKFLLLILSNLKSLFIIVTAPAQPSNLISDEELVNVNTDISQHTTCYDISLSWDHPKFIPDNYIITLHILSLKLNLTVGGVSYLF